MSRLAVFLVLTAVCAAEFSVLWETPIAAGGGRYVDSDPSPGGHTFYLARAVNTTSANHELVALHSANGTVVWRRPVHAAGAVSFKDTRVHSPLQVTRGKGRRCLVIVPTTKSLQAFDCHWGDVVFNRTDLASIWGAPGAFEPETGMYFVEACTDSCFKSWHIAFDVFRNAVVWNASTNASYSTTAFIGDTVVVFRNINNARFYNKTTGVLIAISPAPWENYGLTNAFVCGGDVFITQLGSSSLNVYDMHNGQIMYTSTAASGTFAGGDPRFPYWALANGSDVSMLPCRWKQGTQPTPIWTTTGISHNASNVQYNLAPTVFATDDVPARAVAAAPLVSPNNYDEEWNATLVAMNRGGAVHTLPTVLFLTQLSGMATTVDNRTVLWTFVSKWQPGEQWRSMAAVATAIDTETGETLGQSKPVPSVTPPPTFGGYVVADCGGTKGSAKAFLFPDRVMCVKLTKPKF